MTLPKSTLLIHRMQRLVAVSYLVVGGGISVLLAPSKVYAGCTTSNVFPEQKQHGENIAVMCPGFNGSSGEYKTRSELRIQSSHVVDRPHPYPNPAPKHEHHHSLDPDAFIFVQYFDIVSSGNESALLAGFPREVTTDNPYSTLYDVRFRAEGNAVFDKIESWSGHLQIPSAGGGLTGFNFNISGPGGAGGGLGLSWENDNRPPADKLTMSWTGDTDNPKFTFSYLSGFTFDNNSVLQVNGFVRVKRPIDVFGRVLAVDYATVLEDVTVFGNQQIVGVMRPNVYDVVHAVPGPLPILGLGAAFGYSRKLRKRVKGIKTPEMMSTID